MAKKGRPSKSGRRTKSGRLSRVNHQPTIIKGNEHAEARKALYGSDGGDCIGRAYRMGLLGEGAVAKTRLDMARKFARIYRTSFPDGYRCALNDNPRGRAGKVESHHQQDEYHWMRDNAELIDHTVRPYFDQLVLPYNPLSDPHWLATMLPIAQANQQRALNGQEPEAFDRCDQMILDLAIRGIDAIRSKPPKRSASQLTVPKICA